MPASTALTYSPFHLKQDPDKVIFEMKNHRETQEAILDTLKQGVGGAELVKWYGLIFDQIDEDLLSGWLEKLPTAKVQCLKIPELIEYPRLNEMIESRLAARLKNYQKVDTLRLRLQEACDLIELIAQQQAMTDDWYKPKLAELREAASL